MAIIFVCEDSTDAPTLRVEYLQAHLDYIESIMSSVSVAGPLYPDNKANTTDRKVCGSCFIYNTNDLNQARELFLNDPYYLSGVYRSYTSQALNPVAGEWVGGKNW